MERILKIQQANKQSKNNKTKKIEQRHHKRRYSNYIRCSTLLAIKDRQIKTIVKS